MDTGMAKGMDKILPVRSEIPIVKTQSLKPNR